MILRIVFLGSPEEVIAPMAFLLEHGTEHYQLVGVVSQPAKTVGRRGLQDPPMAAWAKSKNIVCLQPGSASDPEFLKDFESLKPDVAVTAAYGQILSESFLAIPKRATINIHPSDLPKYRGATPIQSALLDGLSRTHITILFTVKKLDAGNIILKNEYQIGESETYGELTKRLFCESGPLLMKALDRLRDDPSFRGIPQVESEATFCRKIEKESGEIDWSLPKTVVYNRFRGFFPWPGSWTYLGERRIAITKMSLDKAEHRKLNPGQTLWDKSLKSLIVGCADGQVLIQRLTPAGGKDMDAAGFWNGLKDKDNLHFHKVQSYD
jgi:methionyl-tRNA formyltransferase